MIQSARGPERHVALATAAKWTEGKDMKKVVVVPGRLVNLVVK